MPEKTEHIINFSLNENQLPNLTEQEKKRLDLMTDDKIDYSDNSATDENFWGKVKIVQPQLKAKVTMRLDQSIVDWFKKEGRGYQTRINTILKSYIQAHEK